MKRAGKEKRVPTKQKVKRIGRLFSFERDWRPLIKETRELHSGQEGR